MTCAVSLELLCGQFSTDMAWPYLQELVTCRNTDGLFMLGLIQQNGMALQFASDDLRNTNWFVLRAVQADGLALQFASENVRNTDWVVQEAVWSNSLALRFASDALRTDAWLVLLARVVRA